MILSASAVAQSAKSAVANQQAQPVKGTNQPQPSKVSPANIYTAQGAKTVKMKRGEYRAFKFINNVIKVISCGEGISLPQSYNRFNRLSVSEVALNARDKVPVRFNVETGVGVSVNQAKALGEEKVMLIECVN